MGKHDEYLQALREIARITARFRDSTEDTDEPDESQDNDTKTPASKLKDAPCTPLQLPKKLRQQAALRAVRINPQNAPRGFGNGNFSIIGATSKFWETSRDTLTVRFMNTTNNGVKSTVLNSMNAWNKTCRIRFRETRNDPGEIRIAMGNQNSSYVGTDNKSIPQSMPTMQLYNYNVPYIVQHEAGHALGFEHEQLRPEIIQRIDRAKAYAYFARTQGWNRAKVDLNILTPLKLSAHSYTPVDHTSVMCYHLPASIMVDRVEVKGGKKINEWDYWYAGQVYPKPAADGNEMAAAPTWSPEFSTDDLGDIDESDFENEEAMAAEDDGDLDD